ncbi:hypothetical protein O5D80_008040 [Batrachochytrium dendrobatidis]|nr:hypothetical protein O5D80_008040 [Batrachochytrium dendrobatidis]
MVDGVPIYPAHTRLLPSRPTIHIDIVQPERNMSLPLDRHPQRVQSLYYAETSSINYLSAPASPGIPTPQRGLNPMRATQIAVRARRARERNRHNQHHGESSDIRDSLLDTPLPLYCPSSAMQSTDTIQATPMASSISSSNPSVTASSEKQLIRLASTQASNSHFESGSSIVARNGVNHNDRSDSFFATEMYGRVAGHSQPIGVISATYPSTCPELNCTSPTTIQPTIRTSSITDVGAAANDMIPSGIGSISSTATRAIAAAHTLSYTTNVATHTTLKSNLRIETTGPSTTPCAPLASPTPILSNASGVLETTSTYFNEPTCPVSSDLVFSSINISLLETNLLTISSYADNTSPLMDLNLVQDLVRPVIKHHWPLGISDEYIHGQSATFRLKKDPWMDQGTPEFILSSRMLILGLLKVLTANGWFMLSSCSPMYCVSEKHTMYFGKYNNPNDSILKQYLHPQSSSSSIQPMPTLVESPTESNNPVPSLNHQSGYASSPPIPSTRDVSTLVINTNSPIIPKLVPLSLATLKDKKPSLLTLLVSKMPWTDTSSSLASPVVEQPSNSLVHPLIAQTSLSELMWDQADMFSISFRAPYRLQIIGLTDSLVIPSIRKHIQIVWADGIAAESHDSQSGVFEFMLNSSRDGGKGGTTAIASPSRAVFSPAESVLGHRLMARLVMVLRELHNYALYTSIRFAEQPLASVGGSSNTVYFNGLQKFCASSPATTFSTSKNTCSDSFIVFCRATSKTMPLHAQKVVMTTNSSLPLVPNTSATTTHSPIDITDTIFDDTDDEAPEEENETADDEHPTAAMINAYISPRASLVQSPPRIMRSFGIYIYSSNNIRTTTLHKSYITCISNHLAHLSQVIKHGRILVTPQRHDRVVSQSIHFFRLKGSPFQPTLISGPVLHTIAAILQCDLMRVRILVGVLDGLYCDTYMRPVGVCNIINDCGGDLPMLIVERDRDIADYWIEKEKETNHKEDNGCKNNPPVSIVFALAFLVSDSIEMVLPFEIPKISNPANGSHSTKEAGMQSSVFLARRAISVVQDVVSKFVNAAPSIKANYKISTYANPASSKKVTTHVTWKIGGTPWETTIDMTEKQMTDHTTKARDLVGALVKALFKTGFGVGIAANISTKIPGNDTLFFSASSISVKSMDTIQEPCQ